jgi:hypothetical protein
MKPSRLLLAVTTLALLYTVAVSTATAGSMGNGAAQRQKLVVESVDVAAGTIQLKSMVDQTIHTYKIDATTRIAVGHAKGTIDQIKAGQKVENYRVGGGQPPQHLDMIFLSQAVATPVSPNQ